MGLLIEPFANFNRLIARSLADRVLEIAYIPGAQEALTKLICHLLCGFIWPSMRRDALLFIPACSMSGKFRSVHA